MLRGCIQNFLSPLLPLSAGGLIADRLSGKEDPYNLVLCPGSIQPHSSYQDRSTRAQGTHITSIVLMRR